MLRVYGYVFCSFYLLLLYLLVRMFSNPRSIAGVFSNPRSIAGVPFDSIGRFRASLLLRTNFMRSRFNLIASCHD